MLFYYCFKEAEQQEEAKLMAKYPGMKLGRGGGGFLAQKRLSRGQKYFDSGDYNMAKSKQGVGLGGPKPVPGRY